MTPASAVGSTGRLAMPLRAIALAAVLAVAVPPATSRAEEAADPGWQVLTAAAIRSDSLLSAGGGTWDSRSQSRGEFRTVWTLPAGGGWMRIQEWDPDAELNDLPPEVTWIDLGAVPAELEPLRLPAPARNFPRLGGVRWVRSDLPEARAPLVIDSLGRPVGTVSTTVTGPTTSTLTWTVQGHDGTPATASTMTAWLGTVPGSQGEPVILALRTSPPPSTVPGGSTDSSIRYGDPGLRQPRGWDAAVPEAYLDRLRRAWSATEDTQEAVSAAVAAAGDRPRTDGAAATRRWLRDHLREGAWSDGVVGPPSTRIADTPEGVRVTNTNRYTGIRTTWALRVTSDGRLVAERRTSRVGLAPLSRVP